MPPAVLAWLDYSEADQRRAREIVAMFSQPESRDELGLGQIRDALSDTLFPGTSVLLTRARYLLFVPWLYREGARRGRQGSQLASWVEAQERRLIGALREGGDHEGLIGRFVGEAIQNLPSTIYWNSLRRFDILRHDGTPAQIAGLRQISRPLDDATEFVEHSDAVWDPSIPGPQRTSSRSPVAILPSHATKRPGWLNALAKLGLTLCSNSWSPKVPDARTLPLCLE